MINYIIGAVIATLVVLAIRAAFFKKDGGCCGCSGCAHEKECKKI